MEFLKDLNESQKAAAEHIDGPMLVIAGAGSGKTRVLTYRIAYLIQQGIDPFTILGLTFTNKAAREMRERIGGVIGRSEARNVWMGTFHSTFARILRMEPEKTGFPSNFTIYDTTDSKNLIKRVVKELQLDPKVYKPNIVQRRISSAKNDMLSPEDYLQDPDIQADDEASRRPYLGTIYKIYDKRCFQAGAMDFDDLLFKTNVLLENHPDVLSKYQDRFRYILVDEYQDTNHAQYLIIKKLAARFENICVVGDDAQSIYGFRGANIQNILNFQNDYPDHAIYKLERNYRSTQTIVNAANSVIGNNAEQISKQVWTENAPGEPIRSFKAATDNEEAMLVTNEIAEVREKEKANYRDFAILYRTNAQSRSLEESLRKRNFPYKIYGGVSFYQRKEVKDLLAYFRLAINHYDEESLKRVINFPKRGIGETSVDKLIVAATDNGVSPWDVLIAPEQYHVSFNKGTRERLQAFANMIERFSREVKTHNAYDTATEIARSTGILKELYADRSPEGISRYENIQELLNGIQEFMETNLREDGSYPDLSDFLVEVALLTDAEEDDEEADRISLMTVHAAKGLEFPYVFIVGLEEELFPSAMATNSRSGLEEERRLFYVALTRAEKRAWLSHALTRYKWGELHDQEPSRFLDEVDPSLLETFHDDPSPAGNGQEKGEQKRSSGARSGTKAPKKEASPAGPKRNLKRIRTEASQGEENGEGSIPTGAEVQHQRFGKGKVIKIEGQPPNEKAVVFFPQVGQKKLLLKFAKLEVIG